MAIAEEVGYDKCSGVAADRGCSIEEATEITVKLHNDLIHDFEAGHRSRQAVPYVELQRFMRGLRAWMGGAFEWHDSNPRYKTGDSGPTAVKRADDGR